VTTQSNPELEAALAAVTPPNVRVGWRAINAADLESMHAAERAHVAHAVGQRQREYASGRALLRTLIGRPVPIPSRPDRTASLPPDVRGSLAHDNELVVAVISDDPSVVAVGVDVEPLTTLSDEIARQILRSDEAGLNALEAFTMKEAAYKAWSALGGPMLDHLDVRLTVDDLRYTAEVVGAAVTLRGRWAVAAGRVLALVVVMHDDWPR
jgi:4'-phosphopantetheinyl transferase EntD